MREYVFNVDMVPAEDDEYDEPPELDNAEDSSDDESYAPDEDVMMRMTTLTNSKMWSTTKTTLKRVKHPEEAVETEYNVTYLCQIKRAT